MRWRHQWTRVGTDGVLVRPAPQVERRHTEDVCGRKEDAAEGGAEAGPCGCRILREGTVDAARQGAHAVVHDRAADFALLVREVPAAGHGLDDPVSGLHRRVLAVGFRRKLPLVLRRFHGIVELLAQGPAELVHHPGCHQTSGHARQDSAYKMLARHICLLNVLAFACSMQARRFVDAFHAIRCTACILAGLDQVGE